MTKKQKNVTKAWVIVIIAFLGGLALASAQNKVPPVIDVVMADFGIGETDAGWLTSVFTIMGMVTALPASYLMKKLGAKKVGVIALACAAVGSAAGTFCTDFALLMATRVLEGVGVGMIAVVGPAIIAMWFPRGKARPSHGRVGFVDDVLANPPVPVRRGYRDHVGMAGRVVDGVRAVCRCAHPVLVEG